MKQDCIFLREVIRYLFEALKSIAVLLVDVHVLHVRVWNDILVRSLQHFLLIHLFFLHVFLHSNMEVVNENLSVHNLLFVQGVSGLLVAKASCA